MNTGTYEVGKMKSKTSIKGVDITKHTDTVKTINTELHSIYGLINSVDIGFASKEEIMEIKDDMEDIRRKLQLYCGVSE